MKLVKTALLAFGLLFLAQLPALAQPPAAGEPGAEVSVADQARLAAAATAKSPFHDTRAIGAGLVIIGAALGIGMLARAAVESMARQPEVASSIQAAMIIAAALIEGVTFFALIIIILQNAY